MGLVLSLMPVVGGGGGREREYAEHERGRGKQFLHLVSFLLGDRVLPH
jgi:hypothetical protein